MKSAIKLFFSVSVGVFAIMGLLSFLVAINELASWFPFIILSSSNLLLIIILPIALIIIVTLFILLIKKNEKPKSKYKW